MKKRFFSMLLAILMAIAFIMSSIPALAADTITVSVKPPAHWTDVYLYVWVDSENSLSQWPGLPMTQGAEGWWSLEIPAGLYSNVIANNSYATGEQTVDLKMDGSADCWIVVTEVPDVHDNGTVYTDAACTKPFGGTTPGVPDDTVDLNDLHSLALVGTGIPGISDWNPGDPAGDMTKVSEGVYTKVITLTAGATITFKIAGNDQWSEYFNYGGADLLNITPGETVELISDIHSRDITLTATKTGNLKFTIDLNGEAPTLLVEETTDENDIPSPPDYEYETYTVYARVPTDWSEPRIWCWDNNAASPPSQGSWPGNLIMTQNNTGWYCAEVPVGYNNLLINANGGGVQTMDLVIQPTEEVWIDAYYGPNDTFVSYQAPDSISCIHPNHNIDGLCSACRVQVNHIYDCNYTCVCGNVASDLKPVYFVNHSNYREVYAYWSYAHQANDQNAPGVKMTAVADNIYSCWIPANAPSVIFNDGSGNSIAAKPLMMTAEQVVFDPLNSTWITYQEALSSNATEIPSLGNPSVDATQPEKDESSNAAKASDHNAVWVVIIIGAVVFVAAAVVTILIIKKKKK